MISTPSIFWFLFFWGIGGCFFYYKVVRHLPDFFYIKKLKKRIYRPDIKSLSEEISSYANIINNETNVSVNTMLQKILYLKLIAKDIAVLNALLKKQKSPDERNITARTLALQLYEFYNDINNLYDKQFENQLVKLLSEDMVNGLKGIKKLNAICKTQYFEKLKEIRINIVAHRDFDTGKQNTLIQNLDYKEILGISEVVLFMIYFFNAFHISVSGKILIRSGISVANIPMFKNQSKDFALLSRIGLDSRNNSNI